MRGTVYRHENHNECAHQPEECIKMPHKRNATNEQAKCATCTCPRNAAACDINECLCSAGRLFLKKEHRCAFTEQECVLPAKDGIPTPEKEHHCAPCECDDNQRECPILGTMCDCVNLRLISRETGKCVIDKDDCGALINPPRIPTPDKEDHCAPCQCSDNQPMCAMVGSICDCVNGRLKFRQTEKCAVNKDDCGALLVAPRIPTADKEHHCAPCVCDDNQQECPIVGTMCDCINLRLISRDTGKCAIDKDDCGAPLIPPR
ncbi:uncharacterized protein LOC125945397 [Dermacentor silvarum]|uniref:uncharacterized protein LOC125945397 n=1 Tax=Dermacentor silvarum TaxID=543639 RepID=UPI0021019486|nr:uncharacterized protein LOC125945397 [Dermacentor silvarum]